jgi:hypothetical protein
VGAGGTAGFGGAAGVGAVEDPPQAATKRSEATSRLMARAQKLCW